ncbi:hypothetical protein QSJ18_16745 [Gordonia sp. ABSL1-1]|uniref:hypothetical protein n=1 Tax=Gordonia sp. ABSL1-1 TaxID=3053923 RepID=UPI0025724B2D|nr:hypothetical protein [Gordonia sp. ABSL1-1]MDL9938401.1 hypothetical protein [Gordonia sp. ABSL1-1]
MRTAVRAIVVATALVAGGAATIGAVGISSTDAAPSTRSQACGNFRGTGPTPSCGYAIDGYRVTIRLRNNGIRSTPVRCDLIRAGADDPVDSTTLASGGSGTVSAGITRVPTTFLLNCRSQTSGNPEVSRQTSLTVRAEGPTATVTRTSWRTVPTTSTTKRSGPSPTTQPSTRTETQPTETQLTETSTMNPTTTTTTTRARATAGSTTTTPSS